MKSPGIYIFLLLLTGYHRLQSQTLNDSVFDPAVVQHIQLLQPEANKKITLKNDVSARPLVLFIFLSPECPICKNYTPVLNALQHQYTQSVIITGIIPGRTYTAAAVNAFAAKYKTGFPLLVDTQKKLTNYLHASITPEVILLDSQYRLVYKGAIDNRVKQLGLQSGVATEKYLEDAINKYLQHSSIAVKRIKATGCLINDF